MHESAGYKVPTPVTVSCACLAVATAIGVAATSQLDLARAVPFAGIAWISAFALLNAFWILGDMSMEAAVGIGRRIRQLASK